MKNKWLKQVFIFMCCLVVCYGVSAIGAAASIHARDFYTEVIRPSWAPPGWLFGPVWMVLYTAMAVALWLVWKKVGFRGGQPAIGLFLIHLIPNALWSWVFFAWRLGAWSVVNIVVLWGLIPVGMLLFVRHDRIAGWLLFPYLLWVSFAAVLNITIWQLNPTPL